MQRNSISQHNIAIIAVWQKHLMRLSEAYAVLDIKEMA